MHSLPRLGLAAAGKASLPAQASQQRFQHDAMTGRITSLLPRSIVNETRCVHILQDRSNKPNGLNGLKPEWAEWPETRMVRMV